MSCCDPEGVCHAEHYQERDTCPWCEAKLLIEANVYRSIAIYEQGVLVRFQCPRCLRTFK